MTFGYLYMFLNLQILYRSCKFPRI